MVSSGILRRVAVVRTDVSEDFSCEELPSLVFLRSLRRLLVTTSAIPSSPILVTLMKEALKSSETSVITRPTQRNIAEDTVLLTNSFSIIVFLCFSRDVCDGSCRCELHLAAFRNAELACPLSFHYRSEGRMGLYPRGISRRQNTSDENGEVMYAPLPL
jgi:hypothetical protein